MRFRRIYWVVEQLEPVAKSYVVGVFTSVPDLLDGLPGIPDRHAGFRVSLFELDKVGPPLAEFDSMHAADVRDLLKEFVKNGELTSEEVKQLADSL